MIDVGVQVAIDDAIVGTAILPRILDAVLATMILSIVVLPCRVEGVGSAETIGIEIETETIAVGGPHLMKAVIVDIIEGLFLLIPRMVVAIIALVTKITPDPQGTSTSINLRLSIGVEAVNETVMIVGKRKRQVKTCTPTFRRKRLPR